MNFDLAAAPPTSEYLRLLVLLLPGIYLLANQLALQTAGKFRFGFIFILAITLWVAALHIFGLLLRDFTSATICGTALPGLLGFALSHRLWPKIIRQNIFHPKTLISIAGCLLILPATITHDFHDKIGYIVSHLSIVNQILNGNYPPRDLSFPVSILSYHYGVDTLFAAISAVLHVRADLAIDIATLALHAGLLAAAYEVSEDLCGELAGLWSAAAVSLGGGLAWLMSPQSELAYRFTASFALNGFSVNPSLASYSFQHSWTLGLPIFLCVINCLQTAANPALLLLLLSVLSFSNSALFFTAIAGIIGFALSQKFRAKQSVALSAAIAAIGLYFLQQKIAAALSDTRLTESLLESIQLRRNPIAGSWSGAWYWLVASWGLLLPTGIFGLFQLPKLRAFFISAFLFCCGLFLCVEYRHSWDAIKFAAIAELLLAITTACGLPALRLSFRCLLASLLLLPGFLFHAAVWFLPESLPPPLHHLTLKNSEAVQKLNVEDFSAIYFLRRQMKIGEAVWVPQDKAPSYAEIGGLPLAQIDENTFNFPILREALAARKLLLSGATDSAKLREQHIVWFVGCAPKPEGATVVTNFGKLLICRLEN